MPYRCQVCQDCESETDVHQSDSDYPSNRKTYGHRRRSYRRGGRRNNSRDRRNRWRHEKPHPKPSSPPREPKTIEQDPKTTENYDSDSSTQSNKSNKSYSTTSGSYSSNSGSYSSNSESYTSNSESYSSNSDSESLQSHSDSDEFESLCINCSDDEDKNTQDTKAENNKEITRANGEESGNKEVSATAKNETADKKDMNEKEIDSDVKSTMEGERVKRSINGRVNGRKTYKTHSRVKRSYVKMATGKKASITVPKPKTWKCGTPSKLITLHKNGKMSSEYHAVANEMKRTIVKHQSCATAGGCFTKYKIVKIQKVINGCLWKRYRHRQEQILAEVKFVNQRMLFHGSNNVDTIAQTGFDERYSNVEGMFGAGLYFAKHSSKANQYAYGYMGGKGCPAHQDKGCMICERKMLLCRVTLGKTHALFLANKYAHPPVGYNSVTGVPSKQAGGLQYPEFIIYRGEQVYPEYLITYKISN